MERERTHSIREFILDHVSDDGDRIARRVTQAYGISRQAANRHLDVLVDDGWLVESGNTRARRYQLRRTAALSREFRVTPVLNPDRVWDDHVASILSNDPERLRAFCRGAFGECVRRALAGDDASWITLMFATTARHIDVAVADDGRGALADLAQRLGLSTPLAAAREVVGRAAHAAAGTPVLRVLMLAKSAETLSIRSDGLVLTHAGASGAWSVGETETAPGTTISLRCRRESRDTAHTNVPLRRRSGRQSRRDLPADRSIPS